MSQSFIRIFILINIIFAVSSDISFAASFNLELKNRQNLSVEQQVAAQKLFDEVSILLPDKFKLKVNRTIYVNFKMMGANFREVLSCHSSDRHIVGMVADSWLHKNPNQIYLHQTLLDIYSDKKSLDMNSCKHKNAHDFVLAALLHELAHVYDYSGSFSGVEAKDIQNCLTADSKTSDNQDFTQSFLDCNHALNAKGIVSDSSLYRNSVGWSGRKSGNDFAPRSPDAYEYKNIHEHFAVNFEYYVLDREQACRRPVLYGLFSKIFEQKYLQDCKFNNKIFLTKSGDLVEIDPKRIAGIDFLFANKGDTLLSRWGHAMFRLIVCAPSRLQVDQSCRQDEKYHLIISFGPSVPTYNTKYSSLVFGGYASRISILNFQSTVAEYAGDEFRSVISLPLQLTKQQQDQFLLSVLENYYNYAGTYFLLTNNCAIEAFRLLRTVVDVPQNQANISLPSGMFNILKQLGLIDTELLSDKLMAQKLKYYYPAKTELLYKALGNIGYFPDQKSLQNYFLQTAQFRISRLNKDELKNPTVLASFILLETWISRVYEDRLIEKIVNFAASKYKTEYKRASIWIPSDMPTYGIPQENEMKSEQQSKQETDKAYAEIQKLFRQTELQFPIESQNLDEIKNNISWAKSLLVRALN